MSESENDDYRPTVDDVDPSALAVNSVDDRVRVSADPSETEIVDSVGETLRVDEENDGDRVRAPEEVSGGGPAEPPSGEPPSAAASGVIGSADDARPGGGPS
ncbi:hypothetical protein Kfla_6224 [Kribbella flavida DSM 17836]|uniref:Uncharacterized protein n=2 Tax=Kribbella flavida TaxID=182640 RepID=D2PVI7_KRIFD|nr:hypothetical protein Kfla_6224 [Kribbella flavida DSM 17836]